MALPWRRPAGMGLSCFQSSRCSQSPRYRVCLRAGAGSFCAQTHHFGSTAAVSAIATEAFDGAFLHQVSERG
eukprot:12445576-Alexandrium_andersonii.AAC.1